MPSEEDLRRAQYFIRHIELYDGHEIEELAKQFELVREAAVPELIELSKDAVIRDLQARLDAVRCCCEQWRLPGLGHDGNCPKHPAWKPK